MVVRDSQRNFGELVVGSEAEGALEVSNGRVTAGTTTLGANEGARGMVLLDADADFFMMLRAPGCCTSLERARDSLRV